MLAERKQVRITKPFLQKFLQPLRNFLSMFRIVLDIEVMSLFVVLLFG